MGMGSHLPRRNTKPRRRPTQNIVDHSKRTSATEIKGCQPQAEGFKQLARTKYVTRYIYVSVSSSSCSSSCLLCSFSYSSSSLHLDITVYILQTIFDVITFTVTCFHLSLLHSYKLIISLFIFCRHTGPPLTVSTAPHLFLKQNLQT